MLATAAAVAVLGERPSVPALIGAALVIAGVFVISGGLQGLRRGRAGRSVGFGLATGVLIAGYTLWDKVSVSTLLLPPILVDYCSNLGRTVLLTPYALKRRDEVRSLWRHCRREAVWVALLTPLSYILVLTAMVFTPVSYVAPAREVSVLIAVAMGAGANARHSIGTGIIGGMIGETTLAMLYVPLFFFLFDQLTEKLEERKKAKAGTKEGEVTKGPPEDGHADNAGEGG